MSGRRVGPRECKLENYDVDKNENVEVSYREFPVKKDVTLIKTNDNSEVSLLSSEEMIVGSYSEPGSNFIYSRLLLSFDTTQSINGNAFQASSSLEVLCAEVGFAVVHDEKQPALEMFPIKPSQSPWGGRNDSSQPPGPGDDVFATRSPETGEATWFMRAYPTQEWSTPGGDIDFDIGPLSREKDVLQEDVRSGLRNPGQNYWF